MREEGYGFAFRLFNKCAGRSRAFPARCAGRDRDRGQRFFFSPYRGALALYILLLPLATITCVNLPVIACRRQPTESPVNMGREERKLYLS